MAVYKKTNNAWRGALMVLALLLVNYLVFPETYYRYVYAVSTGMLWVAAITVTNACRRHGWRGNYPFVTLLMSATFLIAVATFVIAVACSQGSAQVALLHGLLVAWICTRITSTRRLASARVKVKL